MAVPAVGDLPVFGGLKDVALGAVAGLPEWLRSLTWAAVAFAALYAVALGVLRLGCPLLARVLAEPAAWLVGAVGVILVVPDFLVATVIRRAGRRLPRSLVSYGDTVHAAVTASEAAARAALRRVGRLRSATSRSILVGLVLMSGAWNWSYCAGRDESCRAPTAEWAESVSAWATGGD